MKTLNKLKLILIVFFIAVSTTVFAANTQTVNLSFRILPLIYVDIEKYSLDFGYVDILDEEWAPVGDTNGFIVKFMNNSGQNWELGVTLFDDLYRQEATVVDPHRDVIKAPNVRWTVVYADGPGSAAGSTGVARSYGEEANIPGLQPVMIDNGASQKGISFSTVYGSDSAVFRNPGNDFSGTYQCVFKFIVKPPETTTAGTYNGKIIFTMVTQ